MNKYFITYEHDRRRFYSYRNSNVHTLLSEREGEALLQKISQSSMQNITEIGENALEIFFQNDISILIDDARIFKPSGSRLDSYLSELQKRIVRFIERRNVNNYKKNLPRDYKPRVNRHRHKNKGKKLIATGLSLVVLVNLGLALSKEINKEQKNDVPLEPYYSEPLVKEVPSDIEQMITYNPIIENNMEENEVLDLAFEDRTESGKLEETINYAGDTIKFYSNRYGLCYETSCAQITQERAEGIEGIKNNPCQITYDMFIGRTFRVPVYDKNGFTGNYDDLKVTEEMLNTVEGNIMVGMAYDRYCIDKFDSLFTGIFSYNQGENSLNNACDFYNLDINNYLGDENALAARDLINKYYEEGLGKKHGDSKYLERVFSYLPLEERGTKEISYYLGDKLITVDLTNANVYNNELQR